MSNTADDVANDSVNYAQSEVWSQLQNIASDCYNGIATILRENCRRSSRSSWRDL